MFEKTEIQKERAYKALETVDMLYCLAVKQYDGPSLSNPGTPEYARDRKLVELALLDMADEKRIGRC